MFVAIVPGTIAIYLKIATVNCRSIRDRAKRLAFFTHAKTLDVYVLCLQETYSKPQDELVWQNDWGDKNQGVFNSNAEISRKTDAGTTILLNHPRLQFGNIRKDGGNRIYSFVFQMLNVYAFPSSYPKQKILCGDFNCVENPTLDRYTAKNTTNTESKQLTEILQICKMFDCAMQL